jgi:hypothetical protein
LRTPKRKARWLCIEGRNEHHEVPWRRAEWCIFHGCCHPTRF